MSTPTAQPARAVPAPNLPSSLPMPMATTTPSPPGHEEQTHQETFQELRDAVSAFPSRRFDSEVLVYRHPDGWHCTMPAMVGAMAARRHFAARDTDVLLATSPKSGTTWLKALLYATVHRGGGGEPLASRTPHQLVPFLESQVFVGDRVPDLDALPAPRLFATHVPSQSLPESVVSSGTKVVYLCRDPKDSVVSMWHFLRKIQTEPQAIAEAVDLFCDGASLFGPFWEHVLGYWRWHREAPGKVLFLTYEEMSSDPPGGLRRLAEFVGRPFAAEEAREVSRLCAMESLAGMEVNRVGSTTVVGRGRTVPNGAFFRRGAVGDWRNHLTPEMARRIDGITRSRFEGSGLAVPWM